MDGAHVSYQLHSRILHDLEEVFFIFLGFDFLHQFLIWSKRCRLKTTKNLFYHGWRDMTLGRRQMFDPSLFKIVTCFWLGEHSYITYFWKISDPPTQSFFRWFKNSLIQTRINNWTCPILCLDSSISVSNLHVHYGVKSFL